MKKMSMIQSENELMRIQQMTAKRSSTKENNFDFAVYELMD